MDNPNQTSSSEARNDAQLTGWEGVAAMANRYPKQNEIVNHTKFEKPSEDFDTIASAVVEYIL